MKKAVCGFLIFLFLIVMAALRWGPGLMSGSHYHGYSFDRRGPTATAHRDGDIFGDVENIAVDNQYGKVRIEVTDGTPRWSWDLTCWASTVQMAEFLTAKIEMRVDQQPTQSSWRLVMPSRPPRQLRGIESKLTLMVPASVKVNVRNRYAETEIMGVQGGTRAHCQYGKLELSDLAGEIDAETSYAPLTAQRIGAAKLVNQHGSISATNVEGDLEARNQHDQINVGHVKGALKVCNRHGSVAAGKITGPVEIDVQYTEVQLHDLDGSARVRNHHGRISGQWLRGNLDVQTDYNTIELDVNCAEVVCKNRYGKIELHLADPNLRRLRAENAHADLELHIAASLSPKIEAQTSHGRIKSAFPTLAMGTGADNFQGLDESTPRITLKNEYGSIRIVKSLGNGSGG